jgi:hypothetical protein
MDYLIIVIISLSSGYYLALRIGENKIASEQKKAAKKRESENLSKKKDTIKALQKEIADAEKSKPSGVQFWDNQKSTVKFWD